MRFFAAFYIGFGSLYYYQFNLLNLQIKPEYVPVIKDKLLSMYNEVTGEDIETQKVIKTKLIELQNKLNTLEERFAYGEIDKELFDKLSPKLKIEINQKEVELDKVAQKLSNPQQLLNKAISTACKLADLWFYGDVEEKQLFQNIFFPEGLYYDRENDTYRTHTLNIILDVSSKLSRQCEEKKRDKSTVLVTCPLL